MKFGVNILNFGPGASSERLQEWAHFAEELGFHLMMISDHVAITPDVQTQFPAPFYDPFLSLAWLAAMTDRNVHAWHDPSVSHMQGKDLEVAAGQGTAYGCGRVHGRLRIIETVRGNQNAPERNGAVPGRNESPHSGREQKRGLAGIPCHILGSIVVEPREPLG